MWPLPTPVKLTGRCKEVLWTLAQKALNGEPWSMGNQQAHEIMPVDRLEGEVTVATPGIFGNARVSMLEERVGEPAPWMMQQGRFPRSTSKL